MFLVLPTCTSKHPGNHHSSSIDVNWNIEFFLQRVPALREFWDFEKTVLHEMRVSGTVVSPLLTQNTPLAPT